MSTTLNASTSSGFVQTADTSGTLELQSNGTTQLTVASTGAYGTLKSGTNTASTSGTSVDFTGIPSWVKRITVLGSDVSTNGTTSLLLQIGDGSVNTSGYVGGNFGNTNQATTSTAGAVLMQTTNSATNSYAFAVTFTLQTANKWLISGTNTRNDGAVWYVSSYKSLTGTLDRVRITTVNGTDTFDAGAINIIYEG